MEQAAEIGKLRDFSGLMRVNTLANGDLLKWGEVMATPYEEVLIKLLIDKDIAEYRKRYQAAIKTKK